MPGDTLIDNIEDDIAAQVQKQIEPLQRKTTDLIKVEKVIENIESIFNSEATTLPCARKHGTHRELATPQLI